MDSHLLAFLLKWESADSLHKVITMRKWRQKLAGTLKEREETAPSATNLRVETDV